MIDQIMENFQKNGLLNRYINDRVISNTQKLSMKLRFGEMHVTFDLAWTGDIRLITAELIAIYTFLSKELPLEVRK